MQTKLTMSVDEAGDSGSSTESEYYEDVDYEALGLRPPLDTQYQEPHTQEKRAIDPGTLADEDDVSSSTVGPASVARPTVVALQLVNGSAKPPEPLQDAGKRSSAMDVLPSAPQPWSPERTGAKTSSSGQGQDALASGRIKTKIQLAQLQSCHSSVFCGHCCASVDKELRPTAYQRVHRLCHCCKTAIGHVKRDIIHTDLALVHLRFCFACFERNGSAFMAHVRVMKPQTLIKCSNCHLEKPQRGFHKRQRILRPWEELPGQTYACLKCLPSGFQRGEDATVPLRLECVKCKVEKDRSAFIQTLKEHALSSEDLEQFRQWVNDSLFVCDHCMLKAAQEAQRLICSKCKQLRSRPNFSLQQRKIAREEDASPGHLGRKPEYTCMDCESAAVRSIQSSKAGSITSEAKISRELSTTSQGRKDVHTPERVWIRSKSRDSDPSRHYNTTGSYIEVHDLDNRLACRNCSASVDKTVHPTAFQRVHRFCHCCKISIGPIKCKTVHSDLALVHVRFCSPCFDRNGSDFMAKVRATKPSKSVKCSGCLQEKPLSGFHRRQQVVRPWEELPDETHVCLECLPSGFERDEDTIVPQMLSCSRCGKHADRLAFVRSLRVQALSSDDFYQFRQWVEDAVFVCDGCLVVAAHAAQRLACSKCNQLLARVKFPVSQRMCARLEDENPCHLGCEPVYICSKCNAKKFLLLKRKHEDSFDEKADQRRRMSSGSHEKRDYDPYSRDARPSNYWSYDADNERNKPEQSIHRSHDSKSHSHDFRRSRSEYNSCDRVQCEESRYEEHRRSTYAEDYDKSHDHAFYEESVSTRASPHHRNYEHELEYRRSIYGNFKYHEREHERPKQYSREHNHYE